MRITWLADVLTDAGLKIKPYPGWETRGLSRMAPQGVMLHHTVTRPTASDAVVDRVLADVGSSTVTAPLCNYSTNRDGTISVIAAGEAHHAGIGKYNGVSGNKSWVGDEMKNLGTAAEPWPAIQLESAYRAAAAILDHLARDASWLCGHKEYATPIGRKVDPHSLNMSVVRQTVSAMMEDDMVRRSDKADDGNQALKADYDAMIAAGVFTVHTQPGGVTFNDEVAHFFLEFEKYMKAKYGLGSLPPGTEFTAKVE